MAEAIIRICNNDDAVLRQAGDRFKTAWNTGTPSPTVFTFSQLRFPTPSHRSNCGTPLMQFTSTSRSPSLSKSPIAMPRPVTFSTIPGPKSSDTSWNRPLRKFLYATLR